MAKKQTTKETKPNLGRERILARALAIVDKDGLGALSMRRVARELGVEAMSLYHHVANKAALLDGVYELVLSELPAWRRRTPWQASFRERARALRAVLAAHPNTLPLFATRPAVTPAALAHLEAALAVLSAAGWLPNEALAAFQALLAYVVGHAMQTFAAASPDAANPRYDQLPADKFPNIRALSWERDLDAEFELGLDAMLAGLDRRTVPA